MTPVAPNNKTKANAIMFIINKTILNISLILMYTPFVLLYAQDHR